MNEFEFIEHLQRLDLKMGDVLVARTSMHLSEEATVRLIGRLCSVLENTQLEGVKVLVLSDGMELGALRVAEEAEE
jgi:hypothetical protein